MIVTCSVCGKNFKKVPANIKRFPIHHCSWQFFKLSPRRFWTHVIKTDSCWLWKGSCDWTGYGRFVFNEKNISAHRHSWTLANGPIPKGLHVLHNCPDGDNKSCVNPAHLFLGTNADNLRDASKKGQLPRGSQKTAAKLTEHKVKRIKRLHASGIGMRELGRRYGVSNVTIFGIIHGRIWTHVKG
jgi:hypothetical protein